MTEQEILSQRYKVIVPYPEMKLSLGDILTKVGNAYRSKVTKAVSTMNDVLTMYQYPHLFKELKWWEDQPIDNMVSVKYLEVVEYVGYWGGRRHCTSKRLQNRNRKIYFLCS